jgi:hypothetical protein
MKFRIIGTLVVLAILFALFVVTQQPSNSGPQPTAPTSEPAFQPLKIN